MGREESAGVSKGVRIKAGKIQINFTWQGRRRWVTLPLKDTQQNIGKAIKIRKELIAKAEYGVLTENDIIEVSGKKPKASNMPTFAEYAQQYLYSLDTHKIGTKEKYLSILQRIWMPIFDDMPINTITSRLLRNAVNEIEWSSAKVRNDALIPLRGTFAIAYDDEVIDKNPCDRIKNQKTQDEEPDPFTEFERNVLLRWLDSQYKYEHREIYLYFVVAFWTGCRPSELIALTWHDVDFTNQQIVINKGRVKGVDQDTTKTSKQRKVDLNSHALKAFQELQTMTYLKYESVFICSETNKPYATEKSLYKRFVSAMKSTRIRHRPAYNTRHTYATVCLMSGLNPVYVASQLGHSLIMLMKRYARWIDSDKNKNEIAKIENGAKNVPRNEKLKLSI